MELVITYTYHILSMSPDAADILCKVKISSYLKSMQLLFREAGHIIVIERLKEGFQVPKKLKKVYPILTWNALCLRNFSHVVTKCLHKLLLIPQAPTAPKPQNMQMLNQVCSQW